jgi:hypothetical protein
MTSGPAMLRLRRLQADIALQRLTSFREAIYDAHGGNAAPGVQLVVQLKGRSAGHGILPPAAQAHEPPTEDSLPHPPEGIDDTALFRRDSQ